MDLPEAASRVTAGSASAEPLASLSAALLSAAELAQRCTLLVSFLHENLSEAAVVLYLRAPGNPRLNAQAFAGEVNPADELLLGPASTVQMAAAHRAIFTLSARTLAREQYSHIGLHRSVHALCYAPVWLEDRLVGVIEIVSFGGPLERAELELVEAVAAIAAPALDAARQYEEERNNYLHSIHRLSQLYDLERVLNSTLQMDALLALVPAKVRDLLQASAVNLWLFVEGTLTLSAQTGTDATVRVGATAAPGHGYVEAVAESGEPILLPPDDVRLAGKFGADRVEGASALVAPIVGSDVDGEAQMGVLEVLALNEDATARATFDEDDLFFLTRVSETVAGALRNASLLFAERKVELLESLVSISTRITSTLQLDRLLQHIVNDPHAVVPYDRCAVALDVRGQLQWRAISGVADLTRAQAAADPLSTLLPWLDRCDAPVYVRRLADGRISPEPDLRPELAAYFEKTGSRALFVLPLGDDQGRVGLLCCEGRDAVFLNEAQTATLKVLGSQATIAIRNALLYREVPFVGILEPVVRGKQRFNRQSRARRAALLAAVTCVLAALFIVPLPLRVSGRATLAPVRTAVVQPAASGTLLSVAVQEGEPVAAGAVIATMHALGSAAGSSEVLTAPMAGVVLTPGPSGSVGRVLQAGDTYAEIADTSHCMVSVAVKEEDLPLLHVGEAATIKLTAFPKRTWSGVVRVISPETYTNGNRRVFYARVELADASGELRTGMTGRARITAGRRPAAYVLFRRPAIWMAQRAWAWLGW